MKQFHLTTPQKNIWNLQKYYENTAITNLCGAIFYKERRDDELLRRAICCFIQKQSGIRLRFMEDGEPVQYVSDEIDENIPVMEFSSMEELNCFAEKFAREPLEVWDAPMYRFVIFLVEGKSGVLVLLNHLIADAWTFGMVANQFEALYSEAVGERDIPILNGDYREFIYSEKEYFISDRYRKDKTYWEDKYKVCPEKSQIKLHNNLQTNVHARRISRVLPLYMEQNMTSYCRLCSTTPAVLFEMALIIYLLQINHENQSITIGVPVLNRCNMKEKKIAGMFVSTMPLTMMLSEEMTIGELAREIKRGHKDIFRHQKYPYTEILKFLREKKNFFGNLYDVMISYQNAKTHTDADTKWYSNGCSEVPFVIHIDNRDGQKCHTINVDYQTALFKDKAEVEYIMDRLEYILEQIMQDSTKLIRDIYIVPQKELKRIVCEFNNNYMHYIEKKCVHELFCEQVKRTPKQIALTFEGKEFTYRQLDQMTNQLARLLLEKGVERNDVIPIIAERGWQIIVAILSILKAGGAYMPVDPANPVGRIQYIIRKAQSKIGCIYRYKGVLDGIELLDLELLDLEKTKDASYFPVNNRNKMEDMCYVIFTSGSTGMPKGVMIKHENLYNYLMSVQGLYGIKKYCMSLITNFYVDLSVSAIFLPLITGEMLEVIDQNPGEGLNYIIQRKNHVYKLTPTHIDMMHNMGLPVPSGSSFIIGGEALKRKNLEYICSNARLLDEYGPTETTVGCCIKIYDDVGVKTINKFNPIPYSTLKNSYFVVYRRGLGNI